MQVLADSIAADPIHLARCWTDMWNRGIGARDVISADCCVYFGRVAQFDRPSVTSGWRELQSVVDGIAKRFPGIRYSFVSEPRYQSDDDDSGLITLLWNVEIPGAGRKSGIDLLRHRGDLITEVWSITADLELPGMA
jgi:hypothetical protein